MTTTNELTFSVSSVEAGVLSYAVLYNGAPLMASTPDISKALRVLAEQTARFASQRRAYTVQHWNGDKGEITSRETVVPASR